MSTQNAVNFGEATLINAIVAGAVSAVFSSTSVMPEVPFKFAIDDEIFLATALNGNTYTVEGGQEGTALDSHAALSAINVVMTAEMFLASFPSGRTVTQSGGTLQMQKYDFILDVTASSAGSIALPTDPVLYQRYTIIDGAGNFATYNQTVQPLDYVMDINKTSLTFIINSNGNWRIV